MRNRREGRWSWAYVRMGGAREVYLEANNNDAEVISAEIGEGVIQQPLARHGWVLNIFDQINRILVFTYVPKLSCQVRMVSWFVSVKLHTPSQARIRKSSPSAKSVSVVYGLPTTNSFMTQSPNERVTASTPFTRLFIMKPPRSMIRFASWGSDPLWSYDSLIAFPLRLENTKHVQVSQTRPFCLKCFSTVYLPKDSACIAYVTSI